jgi:hypothetical protein
MSVKDFSLPVEMTKSQKSAFPLILRIFIPCKFPLYLTASRHSGQTQYEPESINTRGDRQPTLVGLNNFD